MDFRALIPVLTFYLAAICAVVFGAGFAIAWMIHG